MTPRPPFTVASPLEQLADWIGARLDRMEANMATKQELEAAHAEQMAALTDYTSDVTATLAELSAKLDAALANDSADHAALEEFKALTDDVLAKTNAVTDAIKAADVAVDRPETPAP